MEPKVAVEKQDFLKCWPVVRDLYPALDEDTYLMRVLYLLDEGYRLLYLEGEGEVVSILGYRRTTSLSGGRCLRIDDLHTVAAGRSAGLATTLLLHLLRTAREGAFACIRFDRPFQDADGQRMLLQHGFKPDGLAYTLGNGVLSGAEASSTPG